MPSEGMSDWRMYQLEDIVWDMFGESGDHIVPRPGEQVVESVGQGDSHKKPRHEVGTIVGRGNNEPTAKNVFQNKEQKAFHLSLKNGKSPAMESSWSNVFPVACDSQNVSALASQDCRTSDNCCNGHKEDAGSNGFCSDDSIHKGKSIADDSQGCQFSLADLSPEDTELDFLENEPKDRESSDLLDYSWSDIGNFEDVDRMFRNCDSTFGQGSTGSADELSWFSSSSHAINGSEDAFKSGFQSSCSEFSALRTSKLQAANMNFLVENELSIMGCNKPSGLGYQPHANLLYSDVKNEEKFSSKEKINKGIEGDEVDISTLTQTRNECIMTGCQGPDMDSFQRDLPRNQFQSGGRRKDWPSQYTSDHSVHSAESADPMQQFEKKRSFSSTTSPPQKFPSQLIGHQSQLWGANSLSYPHPYNSYVKMENSHSSRQISVTQLTSCDKSENDTNHSLSYEGSVHSSNQGHLSDRSSCDHLSRSRNGAQEFKMEKICHKQHMRIPFNIKKPSAFTSQGSVQNKFYTSQNGSRGDNEVETRSELPAFDIHSSTVQESSCMTSLLSDDMSLGQTSLRKLQNVMAQLDIRTKLCLRDGLYRLARSAEQRHNFDSSNHGSVESRDASRILGTEELKKSTGFIDVETGTNPIDRSIAHLLFHRADPSTSPVDNNAMSHESHAMSETESWSRHPQASDTPDRLLYQEDVGGCTDQGVLLDAGEQ